MGARYAAESFVARLWLESRSNGDPVWRGHLRHVQSGEERHFEDLAEMRAFLERLTGVPWESKPSEAREQAIIPPTGRVRKRD